MRRCLLIVAFLMLTCWHFPAAAQKLVVIVNPASGVDRLTREQATNIFMGRYRKLPTGVAAIPIDLVGNSRDRQRFYMSLVGKTLADINAYWARLVFSGQVSPPMQAPDQRTALELVAANSTAIAYVDRAAIDHRVKVVLELDR